MYKGTPSNKQELSFELTSANTQTRKSTAVSPANKRLNGFAHFNEHKAFFYKKPSKGSVKRGKRCDFRKTEWAE